MNDDRISNWFTTGSAVERPKEGTLFYEAVIEPRRDVEHAGNEITPPAQRPNLTLVRDDDDLEESILRDHSEPLDTEVAMIAEKPLTRTNEREDDAWPWDDEIDSSQDDGAESRGHFEPSSDSMKRNETRALSSVQIPPCREDDHSASEDVVLCEPAGILVAEPTAETEESPAEVETASAYSLRAGHAPKRIGSGQLVPARLTWRPGDPFGGDSGGRSRFRWEIMLTSACVTAACGLGCIWLLRTLLA